MSNGVLVAGSPAPDLLETLRTATRTSFSSRLLLTEAIEDLPVPVFVLDREHKVVIWNHALASLTGHQAERMVGTKSHWQPFYSRKRPTMADLILDGTLEAQLDHFYPGKYSRSPLIEGGIEVSDFFPQIGEAGRWLNFTAAPLFDRHKRLVGAIEILIDVTSRYRAETLLRESHGFLRQVVDCSSVPTFVIDREHRLTHWNRACELITGYSAAALVGTTDQWQPFYESPRPVMADLVLECALAQNVGHFYQGKYRPSAVLEGAFEVEDYFPHLGDGGRWLFFTASPLSDANGNFMGAIETLQDITERKRAEEALRESESIYRTMSMTDALTSLFNVRHFQDRLRLESERSTRHDRPLSMMMVDLDNFKTINDTYGHLEGDKVLVAAAHIIRGSLRISDTAFRYGGEEFVVLLPETDLAGATQVAERLREALAATTLTTAAGIRLRITASIGTAEFAAGETLDILVRRADEGVYQAKGLGKNRVMAVPLADRPARPPASGTAGR